MLDVVCFVEKSEGNSSNIQKEGEKDKGKEGETDKPVSSVPYIHVIYVQYCTCGCVHACTYIWMYSLCSLCCTYVLYMCVCMHAYCTYCM